jgi:DNA-binding PadR family transcriptional regulator
MSVRFGLLALLAEQPAHGYRLKTAFEQRTGGSWALNIGQVYTTLQRLERDGLARPAESATR